jgi:hypothetical protein
MSAKIVVGPVNKGLRNDRLPFVIDNDSFPTLLNAYQWRGRIKRKRGTSLLGRLTRFFNSSSLSYSSTAMITLDGGGNGNILTGFSLQVNGNIVAGSVTLVASVGPTTYTDPTEDGYLTPTGTGGPNTINYATGAILIPAQAGNTVTATFLYYPDLPVMGLEDFISTSSQFPGNLAFDIVYSYNIQTVFPYGIYDVSFYKNPPPSASLPGYIQKTVVTPTTWNGKNYQQFWTVNYQGALWATNGVTEPFISTNIGMHFKPITAMTIVSAVAPIPPSTQGGPSIVTLTIAAHGLTVGDFLFINEVMYTSLNLENSINFQTGYVIAVPTPNTVTVEFPNAYLTGTYASGGIAQYLTNRSSTTVDCLRWYDGDPTNGSATAPSITGNLGWVNFAPPLSHAALSIGDLPLAQYYLVGARMIFPFKDRLLFFGPVVQSSALPAAPIYLQDTVVYSQNGTPYYTASFTGDPSLVTTVFNPILVPVDQTATPNAYWGDQTGFGGFITAGVDQEITTLGMNEDVIIVGFTKLQTRLVYSGNDIVPFNFFVINAELGSGSTFSSIVMDNGVITIGSRGIIITGQTNTKRVDLEIPDEIFEFRLPNNGTERLCSQRDYINEWIYFTYPSNSNSLVNYVYPTQTLQYNYRDNSWGIFRESYTTYGAFRRQTGFTWATVGLVFPTWRQWNQPWNAGDSTLLQPEVIAGNQQGFVLFRDQGTGEANSLYIQGFVTSTVICPDHCLNVGDYFVINGCLGTIGAAINGNIYSVALVLTENEFVTNPPLPTGLTYFGGGLIQRMYIPLIQTKQFPTSWGNARKTRLGPQQYLFTTTDNSQINLFIYLSQAGDTPFNVGDIVPGPNVINGSLIYSTILYTCPESTNLGLTPANINLQMVTAQYQNQTWHRINTSLIGDTVQVAFTLTNTQMRDTTFTSQFAEIELHGFILDISQSQLLA